MLNQRLSTIYVSQIKKNDFSEKDGINAIAKGESWNFTWSAEFSE